MNQPAATEPAPPTRRARLRQATVAEIKTLARRQLAESGPGAVSLRAIAREMGTASSALYRYFASYDELISALCVDAYEAIADALSEACDSQPDDPSRQWWAMCHAFRQWAHDNPAGFALIFGTPVPGYQAPPDVTGPAASRLSAVPVAVYQAAVQAGIADPDRTQVPPTLRTGELLVTLLGDAATSFPAQHSGILLNAWASIHGFLMGEIFGSLADLVTDTDELFRAHIRTIMIGIGFDRSHIEEGETTTQN